MAELQYCTATTKVTSSSHPLLRCGWHDPCGNPALCWPCGSLCWLRDGGWEKAPPSTVGSLSPSRAASSSFCSQSRNFGKKRLPSLLLEGTGRSCCVQKPSISLPLLGGGSSASVQAAARLIHMESWIVAAERTLPTSTYGNAIGPDPQRLCSKSITVSTARPGFLGCSQQIPDATKTGRQKHSWETQDLSNRHL